MICNDCLKQSVSVYNSLNSLGNGGSPEDDRETVSLSKGSSLVDLITGRGQSLFGDSFFTSSPGVTDFGLALPEGKARGMNRRT